MTFQLCGARDISTWLQQFERAPISEARDSNSWWSFSLHTLSSSRRPDQRQAARAKWHDIDVQARVGGVPSRSRRTRADIRNDRKHSRNALAMQPPRLYALVLVRVIGKICQRCTGRLLTPPMSSVSSSNTKVDVAGTGAEKTPPCTAVENMPDALLISQLRRPTAS